MSYFLRNPDGVPSLLEGRDLMKTLETVVHSINDNQDRYDITDVGLLYGKSIHTIIND